MSIKLVTVDIDGTLLNNQRQITPTVYEAIQEAKQAGVKIVITTGRPVSGVRALLDQLHLNEPGDLVITFNGGLVQDTATGQDLLKDTLTYDDYLDIELLSRKLELPMHASTKEGMYTANRTIGKYTIHESVLVDSPLFYRTPDEMKDKEIIKIMMVDEPEILDEKIKRIPQEFYERYNIAKSAAFYLEITPKTASKGQAIKRLADHLGLTLDEIMGIGDEENDRSMLEVVGTPVVMENGNQNLKKIAKHITKSNEEDGVAYALRQWALN